MRVLFLLFLSFCVFPAQAQNAVRLERIDLTVQRSNAEPLVIRAELADTPAKQARGLMYRTEMDEHAGMLFDFGKPRLVTMWMANTPLSLDMLFFDKDGTVNEIVSGTVPFSRERIASEFKSRGVLELNAGAAERLNIKIGDKLLLLESDKKVR